MFSARTCIVHDLNVYVKPERGPEIAGTAGLVGLFSALSRVVLGLTQG